MTRRLVRHGWRDTGLGFLVHVARQCPDSHKHATTRDEMPLVTLRCSQSLLMMNHRLPIKHLPDSCVIRQPCPHADIETQHSSGISSQSLLYTLQVSVNGSMYGWIDKCMSTRSSQGTTHHKYGQQSHVRNRTPTHQNGQASGRRPGESFPFCHKTCRGDKITYNPTPSIPTPLPSNIQHLPYHISQLEANMHTFQEQLQTRVVYQSS